MRFGDKLIKLRKKNGLSQEDLANKLNVSRQSVSKWESNNTYPETDKIVQICNIFNCSMDDLINDKVTDIEEVERKEKNNLNIALDSLLEFITKTINMLSRMKFSSILKCFIEQVIIVLLLAFIGMIISSIIPNVICKTLNFILSGRYYTVYNVIKGLCQTIWLIISIIAIIHIFKLRYLNYYDEIVEKEKNVSSRKVKENKKEETNTTTSFERKDEEKIILRDPNHEPFAFLSLLSKIVIFFVKITIAFIGLFLVFTLTLSLISLVISLSLSLHSLIFAGATLTSLGIIIAHIIVLILIVNFIINKKIKAEIPITILLVAITIAGIGLGIGLLGFKNIDFIGFDEKSIKENEIELTYKDNMLIMNTWEHNYEIIIDNTMSLNDIKVRYKYNPDYYKISYSVDYSYDMREYDTYLTSTNNFPKQFKTFLDDLKKNTIRDYSTSEFNNSMKLIANEETINKLMTNFSKLYLFEQEKTETGYKISNVEFRLEEDDQGCSAYYSAATDTLTCPSWCEGKKEKIDTPKGQIIKFYCATSND